MSIMSSDGDPRPGLESCTLDLSLKSRKSYLKLPIVGISAGIGPGRGLNIVEVSGVSSSYVRFGFPFSTGGEDTVYKTNTCLS